jgi:hypothetical protein
MINAILITFLEETNTTSGFINPKNIVNPLLGTVGIDPAGIQELQKRITHVNK